MAMTAVYLLGAQIVANLMTPERIDWSPVTKVINKNPADVLDVTQSLAMTIVLGLLLYPANVPNFCLGVQIAEAICWLLLGAYVLVWLRPFYKVIAKQCEPIDTIRTHPLYFMTLGDGIHCRKVDNDAAHTLSTRYLLTFVRVGIDNGSLRFTTQANAVVDVGLQNIDLATLKAGHRGVTVDGNVQQKYCIEFGQDPNIYSFQFDDEAEARNLVHGLVLACSLRILRQQAATPRYTGGCSGLVNLSDRVVDLRLVSNDISKLNISDSTTLDKFAEQYFERLDFMELGARLLDIFQKVCLMQVLFANDYGNWGFFEGWFISGGFLLFGWTIWRFYQVTFQDYVIFVNADIYPVPILHGFPVPRQQLQGPQGGQPQEHQPQDHQPQDHQPQDHQPQEHQPQVFV